MSGMQRLTDPLLAAAANGVRVYDLGWPMFGGIPQSAEHVAYRMAISRRHGDNVRDDGTSGASEIIVTSAHVGTHVDALAHIAHDGYLHGGIDAGAACVGGRYVHHGAERIEPIVARGILLDVPRAMNVERCEAAYEIGRSELAAALELTGLDPEPGNVLVVRTGWGQLFEDSVRFAGERDGAPGPGEEGARWLASFNPVAVGSDTVAFERIGPASDRPQLPGHRVLLVEEGIYIVEVLQLEQLAADGVSEFLFVLSPLKLVGATGSPVRPLAVVSKER